jgi:hypothetical protein
MKFVQAARLKVSENRMLRRIFGPRRKEVAGSWIRLHNEELRNYYGSTNINRVIKLKGDDIGEACRT